ncbi:MAG: RNA polymerase subunit sigma-70 [Gammaproteobacteria bacterium]|nr:RNA polymerase subunit sigma-70 [Gammaproteobacteria bacterium]|tara:strand:+ start:138830 stop:139405 length:576 start_codon:yes stop_codon:yes gene_type:complete
MLTLAKSDEKLISQALNGSQRSWVSLVKRYEGLIYNYCLRVTGSPAEAMDLMQEVFLTIYRNLPSYQGSNQFKGWMMRITTNKTIDFLRHKKRNPQHFGEEYEENDSNNYSVSMQGGPDYHYAQADNREQVTAMMQSLPSEQRLVVELKFFQDYTFEDISAQLNIPVNTIKSRLYAALNKLKDQTEKQHVL